MKSRRQKHQHMKLRSSRPRGEENQAAIIETKEGMFGGESNLCQMHLIENRRETTEIVSTDNTSETTLSPKGREMRMTAWGKSGQERIFFKMRKLQRGRPRMQERGELGEGKWSKDSCPAVDHSAMHALPTLQCCAKLHINSYGLNHVPPERYVEVNTQYL